MDDRDPSRGVAPWLDSLDPTANVRALGDIQRRGLRAAANIVDRLVAAVDGDGDGASTAIPSEATETEDAFGALADAWAELLRRSLQAYAQLIRSGTRQRSPSMPRSGVDLEGPVPTPVRTEVIRPGTVQTEVWLHNTTGEDRRDVRVHVGPLRTHDGNALEARFDPDLVEELAARSSRGFVMTVDVSADAAEGTYRGTILASGVPDMWLPVEVVVRSA